MLVKTWIPQNWQTLVSGEKIQIPSWVGHPRDHGFKLLDVAMPTGQVRNWSMPYSDGSRIHVHEYPDGRLIAHRDRYDPEGGFPNLIAHLFRETPVGILGVLVLLAAVSRN